MQQNIFLAIKKIVGPVSAILVTLAFLLSSSVASAAKPPAYFVDKSKLPFGALPGATASWGVHARAGYRIEVPDNWNGELVVWAHGFRPGSPLELTVDNPPFREHLIEQGYAWAASSYNRNDYDISSGVQSTHALIKRFNGLVSKPSKVFISGVSMGGHITAVMIEQYPNLFAGALPSCGVIGDYALFDYFLDFNLAAQELGVGTSTYPIDAFTYLFGTVPAIKSSLEGVPGTWPFTLNANGMNHKDLTELRSGGDRPNFDEGWNFWNSIPTESGAGNFLFELAIGDGSLPRAPGNAVSNEGVVYQFDLDPAISPAEDEFNAMIFRIARDPQTRRKQGLAQVPTITGDIDIPVLTLHNLGDLFVPVLNEVEYANRVLANGKGDLLTQRAIRGVLHCDFTEAEYETAFDDLVQWADGGVKPGGDDFSDPAAVANPLFGCDYTDGAHLLATACP